MENTENVNEELTRGHLHQLVRAPGASVDSTLLHALAQLLTATWDGNLMSKDARDRLVKAGLAQRAHGYNWITERGLTYLIIYSRLSSWRRTWLVSADSEANETSSVSTASVGV